MANGANELDGQPLPPTQTGIDIEVPIESGEEPGVKRTADGGADIELGTAESAKPKKDEFKDSLNLVNKIAKKTAKVFPSYVGDKHLTGKEMLKEMGQTVKDEYVLDESSRDEWRNNVKRALKTFTAFIEGQQSNNTNKSRVMLPLLAIATLQFHARAVEALLPPKEIVKAINTGDEDADRADRVSKYMNFDMLYQMDDFLDGMDKSLMQLPLEGSVFRKTYFDSVSGKNVSEYVSAMDVVINYKSNPHKPKRLTHVLELSVDDIRKRVSKGIYIREAWDFGPGEEGRLNTEIQEQSDKSQGTQPVDDTNSKPRITLEQHRDWDIDGDGIAEPYVITVDMETAKVLRIVSRKEVDSFGKEQTIDFFTHYIFLPNPEGSYGLGFWIFMGHLNEAANTIINELIDAGHLANLQSGLVRKRSGMKKGQLTMQRGVLKTVDTMSDDMRKDIFMFDFKAPSQTLFQVLDLLFNFSKLVSSVSDTMSGQLPSSDTPATAIISAAEEGRKVFSTIQGRTHRSFGKESGKIARLNSIFLPEKRYFKVLGDNNVPRPNQAKITIGRADFVDTLDIVPVSDPNMTSRAEKIAKAQVVVETVSKDPATANDIEIKISALTRFYKAAGIENFQDLLPKPPPPPQNVPATEENAAFLSEQPAFVLQEQDDKQHNEIHQTFSESSFAEQLTPTGKQFLEQHMRDHTASAYLKTKQLEQQVSQELEGQVASELQNIQEIEGGGAVPQG